MSPKKRRPARVNDLRPSEQATLPERLAKRQDAVGEAFARVLDEWKRHRQGAAERQAMWEQLAERCPGWELRLG